MTTFELITFRVDELANRLAFGCSLSKFLFNKLFAVTHRTLRSHAFAHAHSSKLLFENLKIDFENFEITHARHAHSSKSRSHARTSKSTVTHTLRKFRNHARTSRTLFEITQSRTHFEIHSHAHSSKVTKLKTTISIEHNFERQLRTVKNSR